MSKNLNEEWMDIPGFEAMYQISTRGRLKALERLVAAYRHDGTFRGYNRRKEKVMKPGSSPNGYTIASICKDGKPSYFSVHRLVAEAFIPNPNNLPEVNHKNGNKKDNRVENLEWCTRQENANHAMETGLFKVRRGVDASSSVLDELQVRVIKELALEGLIPQHKIAKYFGVEQSAISSIKLGKTWGHLTL